MAKSKWKSRIVGTGVENPEDILANPFNHRIHPQEQKKALKGALNEAGWVRGVTINKTTGHLIDGHLRVTLAMEQGETEIPVDYVELSENEEKKVLLTLDKLANMAVTDDDMVATLLHDIEATDADFLNLLEQIAADSGIVPDENEDDDAPPPLPGDPVIAYNLVFDDVDQQDRWYEFVRYLKADVEGETIAERLITFIDDSGVLDG